MSTDPLEAEIPEVDDPKDDPAVAFIKQDERTVADSIAKSCRRIWSLQKEVALADALKDLVVRGYKSTTGSRLDIKIYTPGDKLTNGFDWNDMSITRTVDSDDVWNNYVKTDRNARPNAVQIISIVQGLERNFWQGQVRRASRRERGEWLINDDSFIELMTEFCTSTDQWLGDISTRIGFDHDASKSRKVVFEALSVVSSLDMEDTLLVSSLVFL
ncbi:hypothetical protein BUALT_Bualt18G0042500 [Buddleja alternifolia]|uniref:Uncharacterized protein n=1 Tax=Buddleja alternifolia TaxID=168488 RepID=A0AAV6WAD2_9LAMI|nr:hypothetical protein BUALT_Bualt18G0042500 [Buddleja alternifolia]